ncbi:M23 family metallopeptidase [Streptomyces poonensis]|uniref:Peptidase n=1 Tax=Streptomyces poonensis TaxID=68255 RepID=A0A918UVY5_9ACTN|nr:M23 family metallopeptidase [Streptomyces poonensis]GGZ36748.1 peptidase [Streptomyces poonensis]GLJ90097.1 peptidase [Streptomyces poonensis]
MAFSCATGKHRRPSRVKQATTRTMGVAALTTTGVIGTLSGPAFAAEPSAEQTGLTLALSIGDSVAEQVGAQAAAQRQAAEAAAQQEAREKAEALAEKRAAEKAEQERKAEERAAREAERKRLNTYVSPIAGSYVSTGYRTGGAVWSSGTHTGVDFHAASGTTVRSVGSGTVVAAGWGGAYGNQIVIRMHDGTYTQYGHLSSIAVSVGQTVTPGQHIGLSGATGNVTGAHLHFEARTTAEYGSDIDPVAYLRAHGVNV